ncbi:hypothetical protein SCHPADRAFT_262904 [Schizopora paradoxa]|uniref:Uncharacterized protein n=1 Tax=Schizopora paradoxa TaxID=27342 RepID=A0A0H2RUD7_9AGAM|nr:hypothetical protein SCHPADRAFT_262904 [Schizopora paradoxa]
MSSGYNVNSLALCDENSRFTCSEHFYAVLSRSSSELQAYVAHMVREMVALIAAASNLQMMYEGDWEIFKYTTRSDRDESGRTTITHRLHLTRIGCSVRGRANLGATLFDFAIVASDFRPGCLTTLLFAPTNCDVLEVIYRHDELIRHENQ